MFTYINLKRSILITVIVLLLAGLYNIWSKSSPKSKLESRLKEDKILVFQINGYESGFKKLNYCVFAFLNPQQRKLGLFFVNPLFRFPDSDRRIEDLSAREFKSQVSVLEQISGLKINYVINLNQSAFRSLADILGGLNFFLEPLQQKQFQNFSFNQGDALVSGEEIMEMLRLKTKDETSYLIRMNMQESLTLSLLDRFHEQYSDFKKEWLLHLLKTADTALKEEDALAVLQFLEKGPLTAVLSELPGELKRGEKPEDFYLEFKKDIANLAFVKLASYLSSGDYSLGEFSRIEIINNTETNGLAKNAKSIVNEKGMKVLSVGTGFPGLGSKSVVLNRSGNTEYAAKLGKILGIKAVRYVIDKETGLDATVILGDDFESKPKN